MLSIIKCLLALVTGNVVTRIVAIGLCTIIRGTAEKWAKDISRDILDKICTRLATAT